MHDRPCRWRRVLPLAAALVAGCGGEGALFHGESGSRGGSGVEYTIVLLTVSGEGHARTMRRFEQETRRRTGWDDLTVAHKEGSSVLYWGTYRTLREAEEHLQKAKDFRSAEGRQPFPRAMIVPLPGEDPGPPEWNLLNADGAYTVCVYQFHNEPQRGWYRRKEAAVEFCRKLRDEGHEAYYHHGPSTSSVTLGTFGEDAVKTVRDGETQRTVVTDPRAKKIMDTPRFKYMAVNAHEQIVTVADPETGKPKKVKARSRLVKIPDKAESGLSP